MSIAAIPAALRPSGETGRNTDTPEKLRQAATQFESLMIGQILHSVRESSGTEDSDSTNSSYMDMAEQQFASALAARGGLGIANMVVAQSERA